MVFGQLNDEKNLNNYKFKERIYLGGSFGLQFGNSTMVSASPMLGYKITRNFSLGVSFCYQYIQVNDPYNKYVANTYGGSVFSRVIIYENIFAQAEYEKLSIKINSPLYQNENRLVDSFFLGAGYRQYIGERASMYILVLWNLNDTPESPYSNPVFRMGMNFGF
jgi:hypothetical protein